MATYDAVMTGVGGNLGKVLAPALAARGVRVCALADFGAKDTARWLVHLANIHAHPSANVRLLDEVRAAVAGRVQGEMVFGSFVTLMGCGRFDPLRFNCGKRPWLTGIYAVGKLVLERHLVRVGWRGVVVYLPAVDTGPASPWARMQAQARAHGYVLPRCVRGRPNHVTLAALTDWIASRVGGEGPSGLERVVLNTAAVRGQTWEDLLGPTRLRKVPFDLRWVLRQGKTFGQNVLLAALFWTGIFEPLWRAVKGNALPPRGPACPVGPLPRGPLRLDGEAGVQVATQGYLEA